MAAATTNNIDMLVLSLSSCLGNVGVALTGFGMAIVYLFVWQIAVLSGYDTAYANFKYAIFIQALALFSAQPLLIYKAEIREHASRRMLMYFIPITILSTPLGQITGDQVSTDLVEAVGGVLVTFVAVFEMHQKRALFAAWLRAAVSCRCCSSSSSVNKATQHTIAAEPTDLVASSEPENGAAEAPSPSKPLSSSLLLRGSVCQRSKIPLGTSKNHETDDEHPEVVLEEAGDNEATKQEAVTAIGKPCHEQADTTNEEPEDDVHYPPLSWSSRFWTLFAGAASGFLGGLCGIRGPPIILYFLHPPTGVEFTKTSQRATGACITATNVTMRIVYYLFETLVLGGENNFERDDWTLYVSVVVFSLFGVLVGSELFKLLADNKATIRGILSVFLLLCGISLLLSSFAGV